jgi:hypothetical protein
MSAAPAAPSMIGSPPVKARRVGPARVTRDGTAPRARTGLAPTALLGLTPPDGVV